MKEHVGVNLIGFSIKRTDWPLVRASKLGQHSIKKKKKTLYYNMLHCKEYIVILKKKIYVVCVYACVPIRMAVFLCICVQTYAYPFQH